MASLRSLLAFLIIFASLAPSWAQLRADYYDRICPDALDIIQKKVGQAIAVEPRMGASLLRLHFLDCFVNGCDGSILLDDTETFTGEKTAEPNNNSARGFDVIDEIKAAVDQHCNDNVVSCADIVAVAARDSVVALGGRKYDVLLGRRDAKTADKSAANTNIPSPDSDFSTLLSNFQSHGLNLEDLVLLSGAHTIGQARCTTFRSRIYNETSDIDVGLATMLKAQCPTSGGDDNLASLDETPTTFDAVYYKGLLQRRGLLNSDQQLFRGDGSGADEFVERYSADTGAFLASFGVSMLSMGNISPLTGNDGEIRKNCRSVNENRSSV